jgi:hypothetical protein
MGEAEDRAGTWLTIDAAAERLGVPSRVLQRLQELDELPAREIMGPHGRMWVVRIDDVPPIHLSFPTLTWRGGPQPGAALAAADPFRDAPDQRAPAVSGSPPRGQRRSWWRRWLRLR